VRTLQRLRLLGGVVPPRVWTATFGCIWNRWATSRRRQEIRSRCLFGCQWAEDSIEHYAQCPSLIAFARRRLQLNFRFSKHIQYWMLAAPEDQETQADGWWARLSLLQYAALRTLTGASKTGALVAEEADRALWQATLEGAKGTRLLNLCLMCERHGESAPLANPAKRQCRNHSEDMAMAVVPPTPAQEMLAATPQMTAPRTGTLTVQQALERF